MNFDGKAFLELFKFNGNMEMVFHTGFFLALFIVFLVFYTLLYHRNALRYYLLIAFSLYFYYKASGEFLALLLITVGIDYFISLAITHTKSQAWKRVEMTIGILFSLSFLFYFKYANFFGEQYAYIVGQTHTAWDIILPVGISFYTFQSISYIVDTYYERFEKPSFKTYLMYMTYFPHLVAGPIVRAKDFLPQVERIEIDENTGKKKFILPNISLSADNAKEAMYLILKGFIKKAIVGDFVAQYADIVFSSPAAFSGTEHWVATLCYTLQIFCDFSGYTDMAIGISLLLGYRLHKNFDSPYTATNITVFWRKWHISLSSWLRDYIYIPLGGNRKGISAQLLFLMITMLVGGFWHGASWKFIFWGFGHGMLLILHKLYVKATKDTILAKMPKIMAWSINFSVVALLWIPFRALSMEDTLIMYKGIFSGIDFAQLRQVFLNNEGIFYMLGIGYTAALLPMLLKSKFQEWYFNTDLVVKFAILIIAIQVMLQFENETVQPFIYFQF